MKILSVIALYLLLSGCTNAQSTTTTAKLKIIGESLPAIRHVTDMKVSVLTFKDKQQCVT